MLTRFIRLFGPEGVKLERFVGPVGGQYHRGNTAPANNSYLHEARGCTAGGRAAEALDQQIELQTRIANRIKSLSATLHPLAHCLTNPSRQLRADEG
jgi:hypothetical protein